MWAKELTGFRGGSFEANSRHKKYDNKLREKINKTWERQIEGRTKNEKKYKEKLI